MKMQYPMLCLLILLGGCVSPAIVPPKERLAQVKQAQVVAMEATPLSVFLASTLLVPVQASGDSAPAASGIALFNTIVILLNMPEASRRGKELRAVLDAENVWNPTVALANEVSKQLAANGIATQVASDVKPIPGVRHRRATLLMENWMAPIRAYYNDSVPVPDYCVPVSDQSRIVLEVGILNYEIVGQSLSLQVWFKMIDPADGRVIGRARAYNAPKLTDLAPLDQAFAKDASRFKEAFLETGRELAKKCLLQLGFASPIN